MFTSDDRDRMLKALLTRAENDPDVTGAVLLGSSATGDTDRWSDLDVAFTVGGSASVAEVVERWTAALAAEHGVVHHWDLPVPDMAVIRVFLLADGQELDLNFFPEGTLVRLGPAWRPLFGDFADDQDSDGDSDEERNEDNEDNKARPDGRPGANEAAHVRTIGLIWHHLLHADTCVRRGRLWQAEHWISQARTQVIALACLRLGLPTAYAKGAHLLPADVAAPLGPTLVRSLDPVELRRARTGVADAFARELRHHDADLTDRLMPLLIDDRGA